MISWPVDLLLVHSHDNVKEKFLIWRDFDHFMPRIFIAYLIPEESQLKNSEPKKKKVKIFCLHRHATDRVSHQQRIPKFLWTYLLNKNQWWRVKVWDMLGGSASTYALSMSATAQLYEVRVKRTMSACWATETHAKYIVQSGNFDSGSVNQKKKKKEGKNHSEPTYSRKDYLKNSEK